MFTWGTSYYGALGIKGETRIFRPIMLGIEENSYKQPIIQIECGFNHSMCITMYHKVYSWGFNGNGRLGHDDSCDYHEPKLIKALANDKVIKISAGDRHNACLNSRFKLFVWGCPKNGKLGFSSNEDVKIPTHLEDLTHEIIDVSCGAMHTLITTREGRVLAFGHGKHGKLGDGDTEDLDTPTRVAFYDGPTNIVRVFALHNISVALDIDERKFYTWGYNGKNILGYEAVTLQRTPKEIPSLKFDPFRTNVQDFLDRGESSNRLVLPTKVVEVK